MLRRGMLGGNLYTGTDAMSIGIINLSGTSLKPKSLKKGWKIFVWSMVSFILACFILTIAATIIGANSSSINQEKLDELYATIQAIITTPYNTSKYDPSLEQAYNDIQKILSQSFNLNFSNLSIYNDFVYGYHTGSNKQIVNLLNERLDIFDTWDAPESIRRLHSLLSIYDVFKQSSNINIASSIMTMMLNPIVGGLGITWTIGYLFFYDGPIANNMYVAISSYRRYLKQKPIKENHSFFLSPKFLWTIIFVLIVINESILVTYSIHRLTYNASDYILTNWTWEPLAMIPFALLLIFFPIFQSILMVSKQSYIKQIDSLQNIALQEAINTIHIKYKFFPWFQKASSNGLTVNSPDDLRIKLGLQPEVLVEEAEEETKTSKSKVKKSNDRF